MGHLLEPAPTSRARCRGCGEPIARGELRFGERRENTYGEGEATLWFHPICAAYCRPEAVLETSLDALDDAAPLRDIAELGRAHPRLCELRGAERSPTDRARCRHCHRRIAKDAWRYALVYFEELRFSSTGFLHATCACEYLGTADFVERAAHFSRSLQPGDLDELRACVQPPASDSTKPAQ